jgi:hypothetical protein
MLMPWQTNLQILLSLSQRDHVSQFHWISRGKVVVTHSHLSSFDVLENNLAILSVPCATSILPCLSCDGNKSLYLIFVGVVFFQHLGLFLEQLGQHLRLLFEQLGQQHLDYFFKDSSILTAFRAAVSI